MLDDVLWPDDITCGEPVPTPLSVLRRQAEAFNTRADDLRIEVQTTTKGEEFTHHFVLVAPRLDDYRYELFSVTHDMILYPLRIYRRGQTDTVVEVRSHEHFTETLRDILASQHTRQVTASLLSMSSDAQA